MSMTKSQPEYEKKFHIDCDCPKCPSYKNTPEHAYEIYRSKIFNQGDVPLTYSEWLRKL